MRAIWSGSLAFGLVNIPIKVYSASEERVLDFHMLHKKDLSPIRFARICKDEAKEVSYEEIVKGFEYEKGAFVVVDEGDFKTANAKKTSTIEITYFSELDEIDPIYYEKPYYLEPDQKSAKAYQLLFEALTKSKKVGIANFVFRNREHIGAIVPLANGLLLLQMRFQTEIRPMKDLDLPKGKVSSQELKMALAFVDQFTQPFHPEKHHDTYTEELLKVIEQKIKGKGKKTKAAPQKKASTSQARDLMRLLQESMEKTIATSDHKVKKGVVHHPSSKTKQRKKRQ